MKVFPARPVYLQSYITIALHFKDFVINKVTIKTCHLLKWRKKPMSGEKVFLEEKMHIMQTSNQLFQKGNKYNAWYYTKKSFHFRNKMLTRKQKGSTLKVEKKNRKDIEFRLSEFSPQYEILLETEDAVIGSSKVSPPRIRDEVKSKLKSTHQNVGRVNPATLSNKASGEEQLKLPLIPTHTMQSKGSNKILPKCKKYHS